MRFPYALAWEWLSGNVRCCTSLAVEVGMDELVKRDVDTKGDALLECLDLLDYEIITLRTSSCSTAITSWTQNSDYHQLLYIPSHI